MEWNETWYLSVSLSLSHLSASTFIYFFFSPSSPHAVDANENEAWIVRHRRRRHKTLSACASVMGHDLHWLNTQKAKRMKVLVFRLNNIYRMDLRWKVNKSFLAVWYAQRTRTERAEINNTRRRHAQVCATARKWKSFFFFRCCLRLHYNCAGGATVAHHRQPTIASCVHLAIFVCTFAELRTRESNSLKWGKRAKRVGGCSVAGAYYTQTLFIITQ